MDCKTCKENRASVPYIVHESEMARMERVNKRMFLAWLITFVMLVGCVAGFIWYESQGEDVTVTQEVTQDTGNGGNNNFVGGDYYGEAGSKDYNENP